MAEKKSRCVRTLNEFIEWAAQFNDGKYLFRGVPNDTFEIEASAYRRLSKADKDNPSRLLRINQRLIEDARSLGHDQKNGEQLSDLELLAELQHFGAATCLIDFSRSALDALWFACLKNPTEDEEANGKVFAVRHDDVVRVRTVTPKLIKEDIDYFFKPDESDRYLLYQWTPKLQNNRIIAQHSVFLFGGAQIEIAAECVIIKSSKQEILKSLEEVSDIAEATMYPDFDGFARLHAHDKPHIEPDARTYLRRGLEVASRGDLDTAIAYCTQAISLESDTFYLATIYFNRGVVHRKRGNHDLAIADYNEAIELDNHYTDAYLNRGVAYYDKGDYQNAINNYTKALEMKSNYADAYSNRGAAYSKQGNFDLAINDFSEAIRLNPNYAQTYNNRGHAYYMRGLRNQAIDDFNIAIDDFNTAIQLNPDYANAYFNRGVTWLHLEEWQNARSDLTVARNMGRDIITPFHNNYGGVAGFERRTGIRLPADIAAMLTL